MNWEGAEVGGEGLTIVRRGWRNTRCMASAVEMTWLQCLMVWLLVRDKEPLLRIVCSDSLNVSSPNQLDPKSSKISFSVLLVFLTSHICCSFGSSEGRFKGILGAWLLDHTSVTVRLAYGL